MKYRETKEYDYIIFTTDEELAFAKWVMDLLAEKWFDENSGSFYTLVAKIYWMKCTKGYDLNAQAYSDLLNFVERENEATKASEMPDDIKAKWLIPEDGLYPDANDKGRDVPFIVGDRKYEPEERVRVYQQETRNMWRNVWREHGSLKSRHEAFLVFPGDDPGEAYRKVQEEKERRFWAEVERRMEEWNMSRGDAVKALTDCTPRGDMSPADRSEFEPPKSLLDAMEFEIPEDDGEDPSDFDYHFPEMDPESDHF